MSKDRVEFETIELIKDPFEKSRKYTDWKNKRKPKTSGKGSTKRSKVIPIRVEPDFKELLQQISIELKNNNRRFNSMTDIITVAVKEYALRNYPDVYNTIYQQTSI